ncbi:hypothetical protein Tco_0712962 [Tanacetum coccineum]
MSVRQVWKRKTSTQKPSSSFQSESPPLPLQTHHQSISPPSYNPLRDEMINSLHSISTILDIHNNPSNAYTQAPPSPPPQKIYPPSHDHAGCFDSPEAEYVSLSACCAQVLWLRTQLTDYGFHFDKIPMYCDSKAAIAISFNLVQHSHTKHIDLTDLFTKALSEDSFKYLVRRLGMRCLTPKELEFLANTSA